MKTIALIACVALVVGCSSTRSERWPVKQFLDPVTEEAPNVITD